MCDTATPAIRCTHLEKMQEATIGVLVYLWIGQRQEKYTEDTVLSPSEKSGSQWFAGGSVNVSPFKSNHSLYWKNHVWLW